MAEKTEPPTPKKIRDARKKGQFLFSKEIVSNALLLSIILAIFVFHVPYTSALVKMLDTALSSINKDFTIAVAETFSDVLSFSIFVTAIILAVVVLVAIIANISQVGLVFSFAKMSKGLKSLDALSNAKNMFSPRSLITFLFNIFKVFLVSFIVWHTLIVYLRNAAAEVSCGFSCTIIGGGSAVLRLALYLGIAMIPVAIFDYLMQRYFYLKELKMSIEEVKKEFKESEGDPEIKGQRKQLHREILDNAMLNRVRKATVVVKNPEHYAVALFYDEEETPLPLVVGKGEGAMAQAILAIAEEEGIPIFENVSLAQNLYHDIEIGRFITSDFLEAVAEVLRYVEEIQAQQP